MLSADSTIAKKHIDISIEVKRVAKNMDYADQVYIATHAMGKMTLTFRDAEQVSGEVFWGVHAWTPPPRKRLKDLYDLRSAIVHGGTKESKETELDTPDTAERIREEVGGIALSVLSGLLKDAVLWPLKPRERVEQLLKPSEWRCASNECDARKLVFDD